MIPKKSKSDICILRSLNYVYKKIKLDWRIWTREAEKRTQWVPSLAVVSADSLLHDQAQEEAVLGRSKVGIAEEETHRRRIHTKETAKVAAASRGKEMLQFLAALAILQVEVEE